MDRGQAIQFLARKRAEVMSGREKMDYVFSWISIDEEDEEYFLLPLFTRKLMRNPESLDWDNTDWKPGLAPLLQVSLEYDSLGATNSYVETCLAEFGLHVRVTGHIGHRFACPCCGARSLTEVAECDICEACYWEDDGSSGDFKSGGNHMSINEYKQGMADGQIKTKSKDPHIYIKYAKD